jgi:hypothetical protein
MLFFIFIFAAYGIFFFFALFGFKFTIDNDIALTTTN